MRQVLYVLFTKPDEAERAIVEIEALDRPADRCEIFVHKGKLDDQTLPLEETRAGLRLGDGMMLGAVIGAVLGAFVLHPAGLVNTSPWWTALFCAVLGAAIGGLAGLLAGGAGPEPNIERLAAALKDGAVLVRFRAEDRYHLEPAEEIALGHGGQLYGRGDLGPLPRRFLRKLTLSPHGHG
jgi:hypothetical protein